MRDIIYLHGFASSGNSAKGQFLREKYLDKAYTPNLKCHPKEDILQVEKMLKHLDNPILIGSSLGGFYVEYLSKTYNLDALLINPLTSVQDIKPFIGINTYFETGEKFNFSLEDFSYLVYLSTTLKDYKIGTEKREIIVAKDDKVIPFSKTVEHFINKNDFLTLYDSGGHSFNNFDVINHHLEKLNIYG